MYVSVDLFGNATATVATAAVAGRGSDPGGPMLCGVARVVRQRRRRGLQGSISRLPLDALV